MVRIVVEGAENIMKKFDEIRPAVSDALLAGAIHVKGKISTYPPQTHPTRKSVYGSSFQSERQRRWFFAVGIYQTPYARTSNLAKRWTIWSSMDGFTQIVGNNTSYGPYVQGAGAQSLYHKAQGWLTEAEVAEQERDRVVQMVLQAIEKALQ